MQKFLGLSIYYYLLVSPTHAHARTIKINTYVF